MSKRHTCHELGVCNSRHCNDVSACQDYDLLACNDRACASHSDIAAKGLCPAKLPKRRFTDRPGCAREAYPQPTFPFAPGVIQRAADSASIAVPDEWFPLSKADAAKIAAMVVVLAIVATCLAGWWHVTH